MRAVGRITSRINHVKAGIALDLLRCVLCPPGFEVTYVLSNIVLKPTSVELAVQSVQTPPPSGQL